MFDNDAQVVAGAGLPTSLRSYVGQIAWLGPSMSRQGF